MALPRARTEGPTMPCPFCDITVRSVHNPHTGEWRTYHGEDALFAIDAERAAALDFATLAATLAVGLEAHLLALHDLAG
jgi:hypothetical protein